MKTKTVQEIKLLLPCRNAIQDVCLCGHILSRLSQQIVDHRVQRGCRRKGQKEMIQIQTQSGQREKGEKLGHF